MYSVVLLAAAVRLAQPADLSAADKLYGLSLFWSEAKTHFVYFDKVPDLDWDAAYRDAIPRVLATTSTRAYYDELRRFAALLKDGHSDISLPPDVVKAEAAAPEERRYQPPFGFTIIDHGIYVTTVLKPLDTTGLLGAKIVAIDGEPTDESMQRLLTTTAGATEFDRSLRAATQLLLAPQGTTRTLTVLTLDGQRKDIPTLPYATKPAGGWEWAPKRDQLALEPGVVQHTDLGNGIAYVAIHSFREMSVAEEFERLIPKLEGARGLVIDLRKNNGGDDRVGIRIIQNFTSQPFTGFAAKSRTVCSAYRAWGQSVDPGDPDLSEFDRTALAHYQGTAWHHFEPQIFEGSKNAKLLMPKVILTSSSTASAAEDFLVFVETIPNITSVGEPTFGSTGQPYTFDLPGGGRGRVCTHRVTFPDGREFVGTGIVPEVRVTMSIIDKLSGKDIVLERGVSVLNSQIGQ
jgi:carboxyl-terminal processing protease